MSEGGDSQVAGLARSSRLGLFIVLGLLAVSVGVWFGSERIARERLARAAFPMASGQLRVDGLSQRVEIARDVRGIPHILAESEADAWFGLGFAHAQDRLAQMVWLRRVAAGRVAEWVGAAGLPADRLARTIGFTQLAEAERARLDPDVLAVFEAYSAGVNARMARIRSGRVAAPLELTGVRRDEVLPSADAMGMVDPSESWSATDCLAVGKLLSWAAGASPERAAVLSDLIERLGSMGARPFFPDGERELDVALRAELVARSPEPPRGPPPQRSLLSAFAIRASAWALPGRFTASGSPILVAELSVAPTAPSLLYEAHVQGGALDAAGVTVPGFPVFWAGRNPSVAWAVVPLPVATVDLFKETLKEIHEERPEEALLGAGGEEPALAGGARDFGARTRLLYKNGSRWMPAVQRTEVISIRAGVRGETASPAFQVNTTRHGPIVSRLLSGGAPREPLALAWTGARPGNGAAGLMRVARATSAQAVREALVHHNDPPIEVVYADRNGEVGIQMAGWLPRRALPSGLVPVPGRLRGFDWRVGIESDALPRVRIPAAAGPTPGAAGDEPRIVSSGGEIRDDLAAGAIEWLWESDQRAVRVRALVAEAVAAGPLDLRAAGLLQQDDHANASPDLIPALLALAGTPPTLSEEGSEVALLLRRWDGVASPDSRGAAAFQILMGHLLEDLLAERVGRSLLDRYLALPGVRPGALAQGIVVAAARGGRRGSWADRDVVSAAVRKSLRRTWMSLSYRLGHNRERWTWGRLQSLTFRPFAALDRDSPAAGRGLGPFPMGGDAPSVARVEHDLDTFVARMVSSYRMAVDLASRNRMLTTLAPGESEHPGHPHFDDGVAAWREGDLSLLVTSPFLFQEAAVERLVLEPTR